MVLFVLLTPGLVLQIPGSSRANLVEFGNLKTSVASIFVHAIVYFVVFSLLLKP